MRRVQLVGPSLLLTIALGLSACSDGNDREPLEFDQVNEAFESPEQYTALRLDSMELFSFISSNSLVRLDSAEITDFYLKRDLQYAWFSGDSLIDAASSFLSLFSVLNVDAIDTIGRHADLSARVNEALNNNRGTQLNAEERTMLELELTAQFFRQAGKEYGGHVEGDLHKLDWYIPRRKKNYRALLDSLVKGRDDLSMIEPVHPQYRALKNELRRLYALAEIRDSIVLEIEDEIDLLIGDSAAIIPSIRERLFELGDMLSIDTSIVYDSSLYAGILRFRARTGLSPIENINSYVIDELQVPISSRIKTVLLNMERCRWLPEDQPEDMLLVNIPEFMLHVMEGGRTLWDMNVVVGKSATRTSIFMGEMDRIVFSPYWYVPRSIINGEILPKLKNDKNYLQRQNMELRSGERTIDAEGIDWKSFGAHLPYNIRQRPGGSNALGRVKFLFPNKYSIYLHDTPSKSKFNRTQRAFSHGCIRLAEPAKLAAYLLRNDTAWTADSIQTAMNHGKETMVMLEKSVPVLIAYLTAWVDESNTLQFREDIYKHDERLERELFGRSVGGLN